MRQFLLLSLVAVVTATTLAQAHEFLPGRYAANDGALLLNAGGNYVEPYFATKALLVASDAGLDIHSAALAWIEWLLPRQRKDGRLDRYCRKGDAWTECSPADADDSMLALWMELLFRTAPNDGLPPAWQESADKARSFLASLKDRRSGLYHVSHNNHVALFMDNVEIYSAFKAIGDAQEHFGDHAGAAITKGEAENLAKAISAAFWDRKTRRFRVSTQKNSPKFYPDVVAQTYPWLAGLPLPEGDSQEAWAHWKQLFAAAWLSNRYDPHAWGLIALAAMKVGDRPIAECWREHAQLRRNSKDWNILEEASFQVVDETIATNSVVVAADCVSLTAGQSGQ
jgi:hypothetical protein